MIKKLLIANRGEIACRIARTCRKLGLQAATVHSAADRNALHVRAVGESVEIGGAPASQSYLNIEAIIRAARLVGADAVHPGIGFLSEDPNFAEAVEQTGLRFIGPRAETMRRFGDKWAAKREARAAAVPVIAGSEGSLNDPAAIERLIREQMRLPIVLKAAAGGGGRGVRIVRELIDLGSVIESAMREALASFGRSDLIVEEFVGEARHLEVQVAGDGQGNAIHLFERECSLQRRFQKIIEEAPAAHLTTELRQRILDDAVRLAAGVEYRGLGTMEFLVSGDRHYFLECNPRLQVEHTVTEEVVGVDLVELQLHIINHGRLSLSQAEVQVRGHSIQARVYAEDAAAGFVPSTGRLGEVIFPAELRVETGVEPGSEVTPFYDPMIAKLIAVGGDRAQALDRLLAGVESTFIAGVESNLDFLAKLLRHPVVIAGTADNRFIDRELLGDNARAGASAETAAIAAAILLRRWNASAHFAHGGLWAGEGTMLGWRMSGETEAVVGVPAFSLVDAADAAFRIAIGAPKGVVTSLSVNGQPVHVELRVGTDGRYSATIGARMQVVTVYADEASLRLQGSFGTQTFTIEPFLSVDAQGEDAGGQLRAPMMGVVVRVKVKPGDLVEKGQVLVVEESMKMELNIETACRGRVTAVRCAEGDMVERQQILVEVEPVESESVV